MVDFRISSGRLFHVNMLTFGTYLLNNLNHQFKLSIIESIIDSIIVTLVALIILISDVNIMIIISYLYIIIIYTLYDYIYIFIQSLILITKFANV